MPFGYTVGDVWYTFGGIPCHPTPWSAMHPSTRIQRRRASVSAYLRESAIFSVERLSHMRKDDLKVCFEGVTLPSHGQNLRGLPPLARLAAWSSSYSICMLTHAYLYFLHLYILPQTAVLALVAAEAIAHPSIDSHVTRVGSVCHVGICSPKKGTSL